DFLTLPTDIGTISAGTTIHLQFQATINANTTALSASNQGEVTANGGIDVLTNNVSTTIRHPDLVAGKANNVGGETTFGNSWTWTITIANIGDADAKFTSGQTIFVDNLPNQLISYGTPSAGNFVGVTGSGNIAVSLVGSDLTVTATGPVTLANSGGS